MSTNIALCLLAKQFDIIMSLLTIIDIVSSHLKTLQWVGLQLIHFSLILEHRTQEAKYGGITLHACNGFTITSHIIEL